VRAFAHLDGYNDSPELIYSYNIIDRVKDPQFAPNGGTYAGYIDVTITTATAGAKIYYTLDGSTPDITSTEVSNGGIVTISASCTLKSIAVLAGYAPSHVSSSPPFVILPKASRPVILPPSDTFAISAALTITCSTPNSTIYYTTDGSDPTYLSFTFAPNTQIIVDNAGVHTVKAIATSNSMLQSDIAVKVFRILERASPPVYSPLPGNFIANVNLVFNCGEGVISGVVYYSTNAMVTPNTVTSSHVPCESSILLEGPGRFVVRAILTADGKSPSGIVEGIYVITRPKYDTYPVNPNSKLQMHPDVDVYPVAKNLDETTSMKKLYCSKRNVRGRLVKLRNPIGHFDVLQPLHGCGNGLSLPSASGRQYMPYSNKEDSLSSNSLKSLSASGVTPFSGDSDIDNSIYKRHMRFYSTQLQSLTQTELEVWKSNYDSTNKEGCEVVTNAGFFNISSYACFGDIVTNGKVIQTSNRHNVNFGIRNGSFVVGYVEANEVMDTSNPFDSLVSGAVWLVRNGKSYVEESMNSVSGDGEDMSVQSTGSQFATILSARTAIGLNNEGHLMILQVEGESWVRGMSLYEFAQFAIDLGFSSAINLDGGGSATMTVNHSLVSEPSWKCTNYESNIDDDDPITSVSSYRYMYTPQISAEQHYDVALSSTTDYSYRYCEKQVSSITCARSMPPPVENPWDIRKTLPPTVKPTTSPTAKPTTLTTKYPTPAPTPIFDDDDDSFTLDDDTKISPTASPKNVVDDDDLSIPMDDMDDHMKIDDDAPPQDSSYINTTYYSAAEYESLQFQLYEYQIACGILAIAFILSMVYNSSLIWRAKINASNSNVIPPSYPPSNRNGSWDIENPTVEMISSHQGTFQSVLSPKSSVITSFKNIVSDSPNGRGRGSNDQGTSSGGNSWQKKLSKFDFSRDESDGDDGGIDNSERGEDDIETIPLYSSYAPQRIEDEDDQDVGPSQSLLNKHDKKSKKSKHKSSHKGDENLMAVDIDRNSSSLVSKKKSRAKSVVE
jgi:hypothetical protein